MHCRTLHRTFPHVGNHTHTEVREQPYDHADKRPLRTACTSAERGRAALQWQLPRREKQSCPAWRPFHQRRCIRPNLRRGRLLSHFLCWLSMLPCSALRRSRQRSKARGMPRSPSVASRISRSSVESSSLIIGLPFTLDLEPGLFRRGIFHIPGSVLLRLAGRSRSWSISCSAAGRSGIAVGTWDR
jgi:hypothetical protein